MPPIPDHLTAIQYVFSIGASLSNTKASSNAGDWEISELYRGYIIARKISDLKLGFPADHV